MLYYSVCVCVCCSSKISHVSTVVEGSWGKRRIPSLAGATSIVGPQGHGHGPFCWCASTIKLG